VEAGQVCSWDCSWSPVGVGIHGFVFSLPFACSTFWLIRALTLLLFDTLGWFIDRESFQLLTFPLPPTTRALFNSSPSLDPRRTCDMWVIFFPLNYSFASVQISLILR
jgi:hypothetical protein